VVPDLDGKFAVFAAGLVIVAVSPEDADAAEVLLDIRGRAHVRAGKEAEAARVDFEALVDGEFAGKIDGAFCVFRRDVVGMSERFGQKRGRLGDVGSGKMVIRHDSDDSGRMVFKLV
jgi:hypothetical protein